MYVTACLLVHMASLRLKLIHHVVFVLMCHERGHSQMKGHGVAGRRSEDAYLSFLFYRQENSILRLCFWRNTLCQTLRLT